MKITHTKILGIMLLVATLILGCADSVAKINNNSETVNTILATLRDNQTIYTYRAGDYEEQFIKNILTDLLASKDYKNAANYLKDQKITEAIVALEMLDIAQSQNTHARNQKKIQTKLALTALISMNNVEKATALLDQILAIEPNNYSALTYKSEILVKQNKVDESNAILFALLTTIKENSKEHAEVLDMIASNYHLIHYTSNDENDSITSLNYALQSIEISKKLGDSKLVIHKYINLGFQSSNLKKHDEALKYYNMAADLSKENNFLYGEWYAYNNIFSVYHYNLVDYEKVFEYYTKRRELSKKMKDLALEHQDINDMYFVYQYNTNEYDLAVKLSKEALIISRELKDTKLEIYDLLNVSYAYFSLKQPEQGLEHVEQALSLSKKINSREDELESFIALGQYYTLKGQIDKTIEFWTKALVIAEETNYKYTDSLREELNTIKAKL